MGDHFNKVQSGDALKILPATYNAVIAAVKAIVKKPITVYIEKVYEEGSFALRRAQDYAGLRIGT